MVSVCLLFLVGAAVYVTADDSACTAASGNCQEDSLHCSGSYVSGLCTGHATRRCCIPAGSGSCSNVHIVTRSQWGARPAKTHSTMHVPVNEFFIHHTETPACTDMTACKTRVRSIQNYHMDSNGWSDIGYSFLVGEDGNVYEGRGWSYVGAHTQNYNSIAFAASMIGSYDSHLPNAKALTAVKNLIACGIQLGKIRSTYRLYGHRDAGQTSCPGDRLYAEIQTWPHYSHAHP
ncbi:peptidoglycan-recognition protein SC2-like [Mya arenaria]|uniref:peptidoglycan-recognition protein SC2-like n=1 Tax=Mya arenaria TaxID=6604 RepID=UPI0022E4DA82|nr:peptidoglycan-recognition protein SC2-like [Mya arenaria]